MEGGREGGREGERAHGCCHYAHLAQENKWRMQRALGGWWTRARRRLVKKEEGLPCGRCLDPSEALVDGGLVHWRGLVNKDSVRASLCSEQATQTWRRLPTIRFFFASAQRLKLRGRD